ncbi:MAG: IS1 family transposase, partial [Deltaproteobacteria bacterium]
AAQALPWHQIEQLLTMCYGTGLLKSYKNYIPYSKQSAGKTFTTQIQSLNCLLRLFLARLQPKTFGYSKPKSMLEVSLKLLIHKLPNP